ncbi:uncharacterized protein [Nicotiana sylvestris]|uniref:uncharacterized protein n=1 Tax=Nicotiana sylvestris TaxID=4096 RepID=UPI00388CBE68
MAQYFFRQFQYNVDLTPVRNSLSNLKKKIVESFREYAFNWSEQAARVKPPMGEIKMVMVFLQAQEADNFQNMISAMGKSFPEAIKIGEMVESSLKTGRILSHAAFKARSQAAQNGSKGLLNYNGSEEGVMMVSSSREDRRLDLLQLVAPNRLNPDSPSHRADARCEYHSGAIRHSTEDCWTFKKVVKDLIEAERIVFQDDEALDVMNNLLPTHNIRPIVGMICEAEECDSALKAIAAIAETEEKPKNGRQS